MYRGRFTLTSKCARKIEMENYRLKETQETHQPFAMYRDLFGF